MFEIDLGYLFRQDEGEKLDFKRQLDLVDDRQKSNFIKDIISMANTLGDDLGYIVIGVASDGSDKFVGVTCHPDDANLQELVKCKVTPVARFSYYSIDYAGKSFGIIRVESGFRLHQATHDFGAIRKHTIYIRRGSSNQEADAAEIERVVHDKSSRAFRMLLREQAWARGGLPASPRPSGPWKPRWEFPDMIAEASSSSAAISVGNWLVATLQPRPSDYWRDPAVSRICGIYAENDRTAQRFANGLVLRCPDGSEVVTLHRPLCIPSYDVDVEWRDEDYLADPVWGSAKDFVVRRFLKACQGKKLLCRVVHIGLTEGLAVFHLNSPDYDEYLKEQWVCFKGLENALAKNKLYKHSIMGEASEEHLRRIVENDLIANRIVTEMLPPRFRDLWAEQSPDPEAVLLV